MKNLLTGASIAALLAIPALAQPAPPPPPAPHTMAMQPADHDAPKTRAEVEAKVAERFAKADTNADGAVTADEFAAQMKAMHAGMMAKKAEMHMGMFDRLDSDKNGQISKAEWDAHHAAMRDRKMEHETPGKDGKHGEKHDMSMEKGAGMSGMMMREHGEGRGEKMFENADADKDGRVTLAEAKASALARFDRMDTNKDGTLTPDERKAAKAAMRARHAG